MPVTYACFGLGFLAIIGIPPFAGFWSKDKIIEAAFDDNVVLGICALLGAAHHGVLHEPRHDPDLLRSDKRWDPERAPARVAEADDAAADRARRRRRLRRCCC